MANTRALIDEAYSAFNQRNIDGALALMSESVSWPRASEGARVIGKEVIRSYWSRQWKELDPHVEPIEVIDRGAGKIAVRVHQLVKSLGGDVLSDSAVWHSYTIADGLIQRMDIEESEADPGQSASSAFSHHQTNAESSV
ncbi:MAG TPA: nuclear transport factor 2 family protein [Armatimonadota bacterium]|nr:nuclear transport factor 2 family protein [Armatimonadota bacterium]